MRLIVPSLLVLLAFASAPFAWHALDRAAGAALGEAEALGRLFHPGAGMANLTIFLHMATGAVISVAVPLQLIPAIRRRWPRLHRTSGHVLAATAALTALAGLVYIALRGTVGGAWMSAWFALYGGLMLLAAVQTVRQAVLRNIERHRRWALRLMVLAVGSFLYRVHYGLWFLLADGVGVSRDFTGPFDRVQVFAFYLPYLAILELVLAAGRNRARAPRPA